VSQTKLGSFVESWTNIGVGFTLNYFANLLIFPLFGFHISYGANFVMGLLYTVISLVRSYALRRAFNRAKFGNKPDDYAPPGYAPPGYAPPDYVMLGIKKPRFYSPNDEDNYGVLAVDALVSPQEIMRASMGVARPEVRQ